MKIAATVDVVWIEWETNKTAMKGMRLLQLVQQLTRRDKGSPDFGACQEQPRQDEPLVDFDRKRAQAGKMHRLHLVAWFA